MSPSKHPTSRTTRDWPRMTAELRATACLVVQGQSNAEIAIALNTSVRNVREHIQRIRRASPDVLWARVRRAGAGGAPCGGWVPVEVWRLRQIGDAITHAKTRLSASR